METYKIHYINRKGIKIMAKSRGEDAEKAFGKYAMRPVFGGNTIFCNWRVGMYDADTRGEKWAEIIADDNIHVSVEISPN